MVWGNLTTAVVYIQKTISLLGILIILSGILLALFQYLYYLVTKKLAHQTSDINKIRLNLGRILILGLEFIVAADLISTTTAPDYYTLGLVAIIVAIRTLLSFSINREIMALSKKEQP